MFYKKIQPYVTQYEKTCHFAQMNDFELLHLWNRLVLPLYFCICHIEIRLTQGKMKAILIQDRYLAQER